MSAPIPRTIWILWLQGWDQAPAVARASRRSWEHHNPGWDVRAIDHRDVSHLPGVAKLGDRLPAARSDIVRSQLLAERGGVWADASTLCVRPLDEWLPARAGSGFFAFGSPGYGRLLSSWFLAATRGSYLTIRWAQAVEAYWSDREQPDHYFWFHRLFEHLYRTDPVFRHAWRAVPRVSAEGPHYFAPYGPHLTSAMSRRVEARLGARRDPLYKLSTRVDLPPRAGSALEHLLDPERTRPRPSSAWAGLDRGVVGLRATAKRAANETRSALERARGITPG